MTAAKPQNCQRGKDRKHKSDTYWDTEDINQEMKAEISLQMSWALIASKAIISWVSLSTQIWQLTWNEEITQNPQTN